MSEIINDVNISTIHANMPIKELASSVVMNFLQAWKREFREQTTAVAAKRSRKKYIAQWWLFWDNCFLLEFYIFANYATNMDWLEHRWSNYTELKNWPFCFRNKDHATIPRGVSTSEKGLLLLFVRVVVRTLTLGISRCRLADHVY